MMSRILNRNTVLAVLGAVVMVLLYTSGAFAQGSESIKALFG
jgi:preprotein translocase subunit SecF